jgi:dihydroorotate dehydrogenase electron transfer subunit
MINLPKSVKIIKKTIECPGTVSFELDIVLKYRPGQFIMIWYPGIDEKPFSIAGCNNSNITITVRAKGSFSRKITDLNVGDYIYLRGPYGKGYKLRDNCCFIGGGVGIASLASLMQLYPNAPVLYGENCSNLRIYKEQLSNISFYTIDGSEGIKGFPTDGLKNAILENNIKMIYSCGPELMLHKVVTICNEMKIDCQASIERYMKCAIGVCGTCVCGGERVCVEGPVIDGKKLIHNYDFGSRHLDKSGKWDYYKKEE